jgi:serine/threonine-protein kinase HipA
MNATRAGTPDTLAVLLDGTLAGAVSRASNDSPISFVYDARWQRDSKAYPVSLSLPLVNDRYDGTAVVWYLRGLLSDDPARLNRMAAQFGVAPTDSYGLLSRIGEDCAGAVQFARPERVEQLLGAATEQVTWLTDADLAAQLRSLVSENSGAIPEADEGQFSLPGALAKIALLWDGRAERWGHPAGRTPSTHIIKPPRPQIPFHCENEHLCLALANELGLEAARSRVLRVEDQVALSVERYDRTLGSPVRRIHQEDFSQALGVDPELKYARQGAPTLWQMAQLLQAWAPRGADEALRLFRGVAFNWAIAGTDAHPRNYSLLVEPGTRVRLAPFYDIASAIFLHKRGHSSPVTAGSRRLAMAVGGELTIEAIGRAEWSAEAKRAGLRPALVLESVEQLIAEIPGAADRACERAIAGGIDARFATRFAKRIGAEATLRLREFT